LPIGGTRIVKGYRVKVRDTTAAGDVFNGALAVALAEGQSLDGAVAFANAAGALSVMKFGAQASIPTRRQIDSFLRARGQHRTGRERRILTR
jgi:ribokinase